MFISYSCDGLEFNKIIKGLGKNDEKSIYSFSHLLI